uniref:M23 family metallopeptidase n=1 Tax=Geminisphaera colitermitum TaxID=1148786 RepID=UPI00069449A5
LAPQPVELVWPTPNRAWQEGRPIADFIQPTISGDPISGLFGGVRENGRQFHEGIDLLPLKRDRRGEALDDIYAALPGIIRHISQVAGNSSYGRYIVIEHDTVSPPVYTLYAHLTSTAAGLQPGQRVQAGQVIARMGRTAGGYEIPRERAHLHFEIGLMMTTDFQAWYDRKKFGNRNTHGLYNGRNLMGIDPLAAFTALRDGTARSFDDHFARMKPIVRVRIATPFVPDFAQRYPTLLRQPLPITGVSGWDVLVDWTGLPIALTPLGADAVAGWPRNEVRLFDVDASQAATELSRHVVIKYRGAWVPGPTLKTTLQQVFKIW